MSPGLHAALIGLGVFLATALLTRLMRALAMRLDFVSRPTAERFSERVVPLGGGLPLVLGFCLGVLFLPLETQIMVLPALLLVCALGFIDDLRGVPAAGKLIVQAIAATGVIAWGALLPAPHLIIAVPLTAVWIVGLSNSVNLVDNMDGLSSAVVGVAALSFCALFAFGEDPSGFLPVAAALAGACAGFLAHNAPPAAIFMGDAGSLPLGFLLALVATRVRIPGWPWYGTLLLAMLPCAVPIFDTLLVTYTRRRARKPFLLGGRDHSSHRLVALGLGVPRAVLVLAGLGAVCGLAANLAPRFGLLVGLLAVGACLVLFTLLAIFLSEAAVPEPTLADARPRRPDEPDLLRFVAEVAIDTVLVVAVWTLAHVVRFQDYGRDVVGDYLEATRALLPVLLGTKLGAFYLFNLYRGVWRSIRVRDVFAIFKASSLGTLLLVLASALNNRLEDLSRLVILLDWLFLFLGLLGTRAAFFVFRRWSQRLALEPRRAALLGPATLVPILGRDLESEGLALVGVIDDGGGAVLGPREQLRELIVSHDIDVLITAVEEDSETLQMLAAQGILVRRLRIELE